MANFRPDLIIRNSDGQPIAFVEVNNRQNLSRDIATEIHRNMLARGLPAHIPYFLLLSQDKGFLWKGTTQESIAAPPTYEFPMNQVVARYSNDSSEARQYREVLRYLILQWLTNLTDKPQKDTEEPERTLARSGFNESIKGATVLLEVAA